MTGSGSYYEDYMRSSAMMKHSGEKDTKKLLTDRNAYISFLEIQLERVSAAVLTSQSFEKRLTELENIQETNDQKIISLSKVFRLNQEYVEQTTGQYQTDISHFTSRMDTWMEKYQLDIQTNQNKMNRLENTLKEYEEIMNQFSLQNQSEMIQLKNDTEKETEQIKATLFHTETKLEAVTYSNMEMQKDLQNINKHFHQQLEKEIQLLRETNAEKIMNLEKEQNYLVNKATQQIENEMKSQWTRENEIQEMKLNEIHKLLETSQQQFKLFRKEMDASEKKNRETQQMLSANVVAIQEEIDETNRRMMSLLGSKENLNDGNRLQRDIKELRENQQKLKEALRVLQSCMQESQEISDENYTQLSDRLGAAEKNFALFIQESITKADELRDKVVTALMEVEGKLRSDIDLIVEQAVESLQVDDTSQKTTTQAFSNRMEAQVNSLKQRINQLEDVTARQETENDPTSVHPYKIEQELPSTLEQRLIELAGNIKNEFRVREQQEKRLEDKMGKMEQKFLNGEQLGRQQPNSGIIPAPVRLRAKGQYVSSCSDSSRVSSCTRCSVNSKRNRPNAQASKSTSCPKALPPPRSSISSTILRTKPDMPASSKLSNIPRPSSRRIMPVSSSTAATRTKLIDTNKKAQTKRYKELYAELVALENTMKK